jgi:predicted nucleotidyltransferase
MAAPVITDPKLVIPTREDFEKLLTAKLSYEAKYNTPERDTWNKAHFDSTPWGISYNVSKARYEKAVIARRGGIRAHPAPRYDLALRYFIVAVAIGWQELVDQLKRTLKNWGYASNDIQNIYKNVWQPEAQYIANLCDSVTVTELTENLEANKLTEAVEKHNTLNPKLFTKEEELKENVRKKMLEIVAEFADNLREQNIEIKIDDILLVGSNANYNYTKDSDIDLHIIANAKNIKYSADIADALYSAYRTLFNKNLDISIYDIPLELYVETENTPRNSNGVYSVKKDKWVKKPIAEDIPEYDKAALEKLVEKWETKCKDLLDKIAAGKLNDEKRVVKLIEELYDKLRKTGVAKSEYAIENLAFKELRNKGYLDKLKLSKHELISKRLSLEENLDRQTRYEFYTQLASAAGTQPIIQDNGMFFIYNLKASEVNRALSAIRQLPFVAEVHANESGKYDFSNPMELAMNNMPKKYYNIRGKINI